MQEDSGFAAVRFNKDASIDNTFGADGIEAKSIAIQSDGKIILAGSAQFFATIDFALSRYNSNGTLDSTFNKVGKQTTKLKESLGITDIAIAGNKLYAVGSGNIGDLKFQGKFGVVASYFLTDNSNTPPTVSLTTPTNNATYIANVKTLKLTATASSFSISKYSVVTS